MAAKKMPYPKATGSARQRVQKDQAYDRSHGIKEDSARDRRMDRRMGVSEADERKYGKKGARK